MNLFGDDRDPADPARRGTAGGRSAGASQPLDPPPGDAPLAERLRPESLDAIVGQDDLIGTDRPLRRAIEQDQVRSMILWGPPGSGKTTIARLIARLTQARFVAFSAVLAGIK